MIYLDAAATTLQKPDGVRRAMIRALNSCANPGRSGHRPAMRAAEVVYDCRCAAASFFGLEQPERVIFTQNATHALNIAIKTLMRDGGHAVISGYEHNSVVRPLEALAPQGATYTVAQSPLFQPETVCDAMETALQPDTCCVVFNHVSNVFGYQLPLEKVDAWCSKKGIPLVVDASQSAGILPLNIGAMSATVFVCMPGHKSLYGPSGTGILLCCKDIEPYSLIQGGTGSFSLELQQPALLPDGLESGTLNVTGIAGLREGLRFVTDHREEIRQREEALTQTLAAGLSVISGCQVWHNKTCQSGVLSFALQGWEPETLGLWLADRGVCVRCGLHCAPLAHRSAGTLSTGTVRVSFSAYNTASHVERLLALVNEAAKRAER